MINKLRGKLGWKLFGTYFLVILIGVMVMVATVEYVIPESFNRHMSDMGMVSMGGEMMQDAGLYNNFRAAMNEALLVATVFASLVAIGSSVLLTKQITAPVQEMLAASQKIAEGNYDQRIFVREGNENVDELGQLANSFNQMTKRLEETEDMRRQLIGDVSHELLTPLSTVKGSLEGLQDGILAPSPETFQQIYRETNRMQRLVLDLQELSRVEAGIYKLDLAPVSVNKLFETLNERLERQFLEKGVKLDFDLPNSPLNLFVDEYRIGQVLLNLVGNALQYTPSNGHVRVSASGQKELVEISIKDDGIGLSEKQVNHIFDRFYRVDKSRSRVSGGSGIGLTIAKYFVEAHGGSIRVESQGLGHGSTFYFHLPLVGDME